MSVPVVAAGVPPAVGQAYRWTVSFRADLEGQSGETPGAATLDGEWQTTIVAVRADGYDVRVQLASARLGGRRGGTVDPTALLAAQARLATPFWLTCGPDGTIREVHFPTTVSPSDRNLLQTIATETQFAANSANGAVWTSLERDGGGRYMAIYQRQDAGRVRKKKLKYLAPEAGPDSAVPSFAMTIEESDATFAFAADGVIAAVDGVQRLRLGMPGVKGNSLVTRMEVHLSGLRESLASAADPVPRDGVDHLPVAAHQVDPRDAQMESDRLLLDGQSNEAILQAAGSREPIAERRLAAMFRLRPASIPLGVGRLADGPGLQAVASALAASESAAAYAALGRVARDATRPSTVRLSVMMAIQSIVAPPIEVMRVPMGLLGDRDEQVRHAARLAAGALARAGRATHNAESDAIDTALASRATQAATSAETQSYLAALGNSGGPLTLPVLTASLRDAREGVRAAAARGLRLVPGTEASERLVTTIATDGSGAVREAALFAIGFRVPLSGLEWDAVLKAAHDDEAAGVRTRAIGIIRDTVARPAGADAVLEAIARDDAVEAVRRLAARSLEAVRRETGAARTR